MKIHKTIKRIFGFKEQVANNDPKYIRVLEIDIEPQIENHGSLKTTRNGRCGHKTLLINQAKSIICEIGYIFASRDMDQIEAWNKRDYDYHPIQVLEGDIKNIQKDDLFEIINDYKNPDRNASSKEELEELKHQLQTILDQTKN